MLLRHLHNSEDDPRLLFDGLPYPAVMRLAALDWVVREALARLPARYEGWG